MAKIVRRISKHRVSASLRQTNVRLSQENKLEIKIAEAEAKLKSLREKGAPKAVQSIQENEIMRLNSLLKLARSRRLESQRKFRGYIDRNNNLNDDDDDESSTPSV